MRRDSLGLLAVACLLALAAAPPPAADDGNPSSRGGGPPLDPTSWAIETCRANNGTRLRPWQYSNYSCVHCFRYIYKGGAEALAGARNLSLASVARFADSACAALAAVDPKQAPPKDECAAKVRSCCEAAVDCCRAQLAMARARDGPPPSGFCPATWDGLHCFNDTAAGTVAEFPCPHYMLAPNMNGQFSISCTDDATWETKTSGGIVWESTNYLTCPNSSLDKWSIIARKISLSFYCVSLCFLLPAVGVFLGYESLRRQQRIIIHVNLFLALTLDAALSIATTKLYFIDVNETSLRSLESAVQTQSDAMPVLHSGGVCIVLTVLHRTMQSAMFMWIFVEGFYLHRLLIRAFDRERFLLSYYLFGWGTPVLINAVYCALRLALPHFSKINGRCWISDASPLEWLKDGGNLLCILLNVIFFINILRILVKKLHSNPTETNNYRRAVRATCILVPLFGLQWLLMMYRPDRNGDPGIMVYKVFQAIVRGSHGAIVAIVFCFANAEVRALISKSLERRGLRGRLSRPSIDNRPTMYSTVPTGAPRESIVMATLPPSVKTTRADVAIMPRIPDQRDGAGAMKSS